MRGLTMVELLVTIAVAGVLLAVAVPNLQTFVAGRAVTAQSEDFISALHFARSESIKRAGAVSMCRTSAAAPSTCSTATTGNWQYWIVFAQTPASTIGTFDTTKGDIALRVQSSAPGSVTYDTIPTTSPKYYSFQATGIVVSDSTTLGSSPATPIVTMTPKLPNSNPAYARYERQICLNRQGRATAVDGNASCTS
jgi:type IV fimbrial biogenesis protein FimT